MRKKTESNRARSVQPRFRILCGGDIALGPGKAELLALIGQTGSINQAAKRMNMSYMRAWSLVQTMNQCFKEPLVLAAHGGEGGGGAELSETGRRVLALYRQMEAKAAKATRATWNKMQSHFKS
jgi:molybdate transport system regulatory protein